MRAYNFFVGGPKFTIFLFNGDESLLITPFTACRYLYAFQRYSRSKSIVFLHRTKFFGRFLLSKILRGQCPPSKVVPALSLQSRGTSRGKVSWGYSHYPLSYRRALAEIQYKPANAFGRTSNRVTVVLMGCLHDPANVQQISSKCIQNRPTRANVGRLLEVCWTFAGSCKHPITVVRDHRSHENRFCLLCQWPETKMLCALPLLISNEGLL